MITLKIDKEKANRVFDLLVKIGGTYEPDRGSFIYHHCERKEGCSEWRFGGKLGFGGKYRSKTNRVDCYKEDETPERIKIINELNDALAKIENPNCPECGHDYTYDIGFDNMECSKCLHIWKFKSKNSKGL